MNTDRDDLPDEPVFELAPDSHPDDDDDRPIRRNLPLDTLFTSEALAFAGIVLGLLAAVSPFTNLVSAFNPFILYDGDPEKGWLLGPPAAQAGAGVALGLGSWWRAVVSERDVPRLAGAAVLLGGAVLIFIAVLWLAGPEPAPQFDA